MRYTGDGLAPEDPKQFIASTPEEDSRYETSDRFKLDIFPTEVAAGKGSYAIRISGAANVDAELQYRFNEGPPALITVHLNPEGETRFFVSNETKRGTYRFVGMKIPPGDAWIKAAATITVTD
jgi:hypothetical protein